MEYRQGYHSVSYDIWYQPDRSTWRTLAFGCQYALILGRNDPELAEQCATAGLEARFAPVPPRRLERLVGGCLLITSSDLPEPLLVLSLGNSAPVPALQSLLRDLPPMSPISHLYDEALDQWEVAEPTWSGAAFEAGHLVQRVSGGDVGQVIKLHVGGSEALYDVDFGSRVTGLPESALRAAAGLANDPREWIAQQPAKASDIAMTLSWTRIAYPLADVLYSFGTSRTVFRPYQFRPVLKILEAERPRLLIADEVGLGKTIEAGLIWSELEQRGLVSNALVVCPSSLRHKWQEEMRLRFGRRLPILTKTDLAERLAAMRRGEQETLSGIASLEMLRSAQPVVEELVALLPVIDLVIIDEAHAFRNKGTQTYRLGSDLARLADALIMLSATPLNLARSDLFNLLNLLDEQHFGDFRVFEEQAERNRLVTAALRSIREDLDGGRRAVAHLLAEFPEQDDPDLLALREITKSGGALATAELAEADEHLRRLHTLAPVYTRTRKIDTPDKKAVREPLNGSVRWTPEEAAVYQALIEAQRNKALAAGVPAGFALQMPLRQAASCLSVALKKLGSVSADWDDDDELEAGIDEAFDAAQHLPVQRTLSLPKDADGRSIDSKYDVFRTTMAKGLAQGSGQALVFSFFRGTLSYLASRLAEDGYRVAVMTGKTPPMERQILMDDFRGRKYQILLCSEVAAEGLDFEFCNVIVNYDLPWNPMRVEQRIGRLDRFGQEHDKIFIVNMMIPGTIETDIFFRLYDRIGVFRETVGDLEPILQDLESRIPEILDPRLTPEQRESRVRAYEQALADADRDRDRIRTSDVLVADLDRFLIEGFTDHTPRPGGYIGHAELVNLANHYLPLLDGRMRPDPVRASAFRISGPARLAQRIRALPPGEQFVVDKFSVANDVETGGHVVALEESETLQSSIAHLSVRHPLVQSAVAEYRENPFRLARFGSVSGTPFGIDRPMLVLFALFETTGVRPRMELAHAAADLEGVVDGELGGLIIAALASGGLVDGTPLSVDLGRAFAVAHEALLARRASLQDRRRTENRARIRRLRRSRERELEIKLQSDQKVLAEVRREGRDDTIWVRRVQRLKADAERLAEHFDNQQELIIEQTVVATVLVTP